MLVLFDLDGTLADTAHDLIAATNHVRISQGLAPMPPELLRNSISAGTVGLLKVALGIDKNDPDFPKLRQILLDYYADHLHTHTTLFPHIRELLNGLSDQKIKWGIVTNKPTQYTLPLIAFLGLDKDSQACVCGDTLIQAKPHPAPLFYAAGLAHSHPSETIYIGDSLTDIQAAQAAGMKSIAAAYGYCDSDDALSWKADAVAFTSEELSDHIHTLAQTLNTTH
ncbi:HAD family hydrolase [Basilea psittacipulmonis]|uniref:phosphoglycolate phosphatase n=1 Tax=Basilea psittacipulmonis DSM 24701 TaxID=1072685 RepID=A0A077DIC6_9BURK|nr:HAD-IA family hydrolase [Basilea psittacipulmonis]AIL32923.1 hypothetical protein IX83_05985 [Basilea psittacipulmonis DSM 24701]